VVGGIWVLHTLLGARIRPRLCPPSISDLKLRYVARLCRIKDVDGMSGDAGSSKGKKVH